MCSSSFNPCCSSHNARLHRTVSIYLLEDVATSRDTDTEACGAIASTNRGFYISLYIIYFSILLLQVWAGWCFFLPIISFPCWQNGVDFFLKTLCISQSEFSLDLNLTLFLAPPKRDSKFTAEGLCANCLKGTPPIGLKTWQQKFYNPGPISSYFYICFFLIGGS